MNLEASECSANAKWTYFILELLLIKILFFVNSVEYTSSRLPCFNLSVIC